MQYFLERLLKIPYKTSLDEFIREMTSTKTILAVFQHLKNNIEQIAASAIYHLVYTLVG